MRLKCKHNIVHILKLLLVTNSNRSVSNVTKCCVTKFHREMLVPNAVFVEKFLMLPLAPSFFFFLIYCKGEGGIDGHYYVQYVWFP